MEYTVVDPDLHRPSQEGRDLLRGLHPYATFGAEGSTSPHAALIWRADGETPLRAIPEPPEGA